MTIRPERPRVEPVIIYEDESLLVLNKPAGLVVHADGRTVEVTLVDWLIAHYPEIISVGEPLILASGEKIHRPGIVHRLDRETSGVLVVAKTKKTYEFLKDQFQNRETAKTYRAFAWGRMTRDEGRIDMAIGKSRKNFRQWVAGLRTKGEARDAITDYKVLIKTDAFTYLEAYPRTGRTHQIRVHLKALNFPVVGDTLYAPGKPYALGFERAALHAHTLVIDMPDGSRRKFEAPLPPDFLAAEETLRKTVTVADSETV